MSAQKSLLDIAHDLRTPLSIIQLTAEALIAQSKDESVKKDLDIIMQQVARLTELANKLSAPRE